MTRNRDEHINSSDSYQTEITDHGGGNEGDEKEYARQVDALQQELAPIAPITVYPHQIQHQFDLSRAESERLLEQLKAEASMRVEDIEIGWIVRGGE